MPIHERPEHFVQIVENALDQSYLVDIMKWDRIYTFYEKRYLNWDSPEKEAFRQHSYAFRNNQIYK
jgi:hypothetical protein